jgi:hypothetical protein
MSLIIALAFIAGVVSTNIATNLVFITMFGFGGSISSMLYLLRSPRDIFRLALFMLTPVPINLVNYADEIAEELTAA